MVPLGYLDSCFHLCTPPFINQYSINVIYRNLISFITPNNIAKLERKKKDTSYGESHVRDWHIKTLYGELHVPVSHIRGYFVPLIDT